MRKYLSSTLEASKVDILSILCFWILASISDTIEGENSAPGHENEFSSTYGR